MTNDAFRRVDEVEDRCHAAGMLGLILISQDRTLEAHEVLDEAIDLCEDDEFAWCRWMLLEIKSKAFRANQDLDSAIQCMEEAFVMRQRQEAISAACLRTIADLYLESGRVWEATEMYRMAITHAREAGADRELERIEVKMNGLKHQRESERGRLTLRGCKLPIWERSH
jgi:tetratricopeptide (TPR) repeat protein